ncbi:MAG: DUF4469 domain-containing protein [Prevotellaceae bacterium]|jgi:hypothetical protein|nr:DUF4469 domain-containing protein [Prevotellaceae bacterium]
MKKFVFAAILMAFMWSSLFAQELPVVLNAQFSHALDKNEPKLLKVLVPSLPATEYTIVIRTQSSAKSRGTLLKDVHEIKSDFTVTPA